MTKPTEHVCDSKRIDDFLNERLSNSQQAEFEAHLSGCSQCQREIQQQAAEPEHWGHAVALLGQTSSIAFGEFASDSDSGFRSRQVQSVLDSLAPTDDPEMLGRVDDYEIIGVVGVGGMGAVLKGFDRSLRRVVAIKIMAPHLAGSGSARTRFQREARAAAAITHDNVIDIYGVSEANGLPYLVMPFARGPSLQKRIDEGGPLSVAEVLRIGRQIAAGLTAAHEQGLVHRDIKPANILLNDGIERLLITDFGVARAMDDASMTRTGVIAGTPQYMSPEQARGESVDYRSDLFSLGSVLYTACTGRPPFRSEAAYGILRRITDDDPRPIHEVNPDIPDWLGRIIERLMAKHPADRFQNASEVTELLDGCLAHLQQPIQTPLPQSIASPTRPEAVASSQVDQQNLNTTTPRSFKISRTGVWGMVSSLLLACMAFAGFQMTAPADIAGQWKGENWSAVSLSSVDEATDWYTGAFTNAAGQRGALQLEWSRLQRRYNGRWKLGDQQSGSITLRVGGKEVRGAVSVDPDSDVVANTPRLREFSWTRATGNSPSVRPVSGVKATGHPDFERANLERKLALAQSQSATGIAWLNACKSNQAAMKKVMESRDAELKSLEKGLHRNALAKLNADALAEDKLEAEKKQHAANTAALQQMLNKRDQQKSLLEQGAVSESELQTIEQKLRALVAQEKASSVLVQSAENSLAAKKKDVDTMEQKVSVDFDIAEKLYDKSVDDWSRANIEVSKAESELAKAQALVQDLQARLSGEPRFSAVKSTSRAQIPSPYAANSPDQDTRFSDSTQPVLKDLSPAQPIKVPNKLNDYPFSKSAATPKSATVNMDEGEPFTATPSPTTFDSAAAFGPVIAADSLTTTFGPVSDLTRRLREGRNQVKVTEAAIESNKVKLSKIAKELSDIENQIARAQQQLKSDDAEQAAQSQKEIPSLQEQLRSSQNIQNALKTEEIAFPAVLRTTQQQLADAEAELQTIVKLLQAQLLALEKQQKLQSTRTNTAKRRFELGDGDLEDVMTTEQPLAETEAKIAQLSLLLEMYNNIGNAQSPEEFATPAEPKAE